MRNPRVLIVDDETFVRDSLAEVLRHAGFEVRAEGGVDRAIDALRAEKVDVVLSDLRMPVKDGRELLRATRTSGVTVPIVMITGVGTVSEAVAAMKEGAYDFLQKPVDPEALVHAVRRAAEHRALEAEVRTLRGRLSELDAPSELVGASPALERVRALIAQVARTDATVLVTGESGTGKELAARLVHARSARADRPFVLVHCGALGAAEFEPELFGATPGATPTAERGRRGRIAAAEGGTLVLDQIGALEPALQAKLLRFLESGEYRPLGEEHARSADVRVIAITNEDLASRARAGTFRGDLYHRIAVFPLAMPRLAEHKEDLAAIAAHLLVLAAAKRPFGGSALELAPAALEVLARYDWPGNVRELANLLERAQILAQGRPLDAELFETMLELPLSSPASSTHAPGPAEFQLRKNLDALEKELVQRALAHTGNKKKEAALLLGIDPRNLGYYLRKHELVPDGT